MSSYVALSSDPAAGSNPATHRNRRRAIAACVLVVTSQLVYGAWTVDAQSIVDGRRVEFTPSADNDTVVGGVAIVQKYSLSVSASGSSVVTATADLGKPTPDSDGFMRVAFVPLLSAPLQVGIVYEARVAAVGPGGSTPSAVSNTFMLTSACVTSTISPSTATVGAGGGSGTLAVSSSCQWMASSGVSWISVTSASPVTGNGVVAYTVAPNALTAARTGTLTVAGTTFTVNQAAAPCTYSITPASLSIAAGGGNGSVAVTAGAGCAWTAASNDTWVSVTSAATGTGNATVRFSAAANPGTAPRSGTLTVAGQTVTVTQGVCAYTVSPTSLSEGAAAVTGTITVTTTPGCGWTSTGSAAWLTVTGAGSGSGTATFAVAANLATARTAAVTVAGQPITVTQAAAAPPGPPSNLRIIGGGGLQ